MLGAMKLLTVARIASVAAPVLAAVIVAVRYPTLPETVPIHFDITGGADLFGPRWLVFVLVGLWLAIAVLLVALSTRPEKLNYPSAPPAGAAERLYRTGTWLLVGTALAVAVLFAGALALVVGLPAAPLLWLGGLALAAILVVGFVRMSRVTKTRSA